MARVPDGAPVEAEDPARSAICALLGVCALAPVVDDQAAWLDEETVLYGLADGARVWVQPADGSGRPRVFLANALAPAVVAQAS